MLPPMRSPQRRLNETPNYHNELVMVINGGCCSKETRKHARLLLEQNTYANGSRSILNIEIEDFFRAIGFEFE